MTLDDLLAATPAPPAEADAEELLAAFEAMFAARKALIEKLSGTIAVVSPEDVAAASLLNERQAEWSEALARAQRQVAQARIGAKKLKGYAPAL